MEVADIFRDHGAAWRSANAGHVSLDQLKVMSAIERCCTVALVGLQPMGLSRGGHVARCEDCANTVIAYNSCRNRHCPKCQATAEATLTIAADPKRPGARIGIAAVLHSWGSDMTHHPHVHMMARLPASENLHMTG